MSTKIYDAYRLKEGVNPWDLAVTIRQRAEERIVAELRRVYTAWCEADRRPAIERSLEHVADGAAFDAKIKEHGFPYSGWMDDYHTYRQKWKHEIDDDKYESEAIRKYLIEKKIRKEDETDFLTPIDCSDYVYKRYGEQLSSMQRDTFNLDASVAIIEHEGRYYLRAYSDRALLGDVLEFVATLSELEDFHYQNQTDQPKEVSDEEWEHRRVTWEAIYAGRAHTLGPRYLVADVMTFHGFRNLDPAWDMAREKLFPPKVVTDG